MKLTRRQEEFIINLQDLNQELDGPIHYSILAERLGVSPFTAYDMLCLLEEKGLARSAYQLATDKSGPGRAERVFFPTENAYFRRQELLKEYDRNDIDEEDLLQVILDKFHTSNITYKYLPEEMLSRIPVEGEGSVLYCIKVILIMAIRLNESSSKKIIFEYFNKLFPASDNNRQARLSFLGGFGFGVLAQEGTYEERLLHKLFEHVQNYQENVNQMNFKDCLQLEQYLSKTYLSLFTESSLSKIYSC
jgi:hypothetical protein